VARIGIDTEHLSVAVSATEDDAGFEPGLGTGEPGIGGAGQIVGEDQ
jgi:hypothetical protein